MPDGDTEADWREQGESLLMRNQCAEALDLYTRVLEDHPDDPAAWLGKAHWPLPYRDATRPSIAMRPIPSTAMYARLSPRLFLAQRASRVRK